MVLWVICGARRGVGKTHLAQRLSEILPGAVFAKYGHGEIKAGKTEHYFQDPDSLAAFIEETGPTCENMIVESNALARKGGGDIIIYIGAGREGIHSSSIRRDARKLEQAAHIRICPKAVSRPTSREDNLETIAAKLPSIDVRLHPLICDTFSAQADFLEGKFPGSGLAVRTKVWFVKDGKHVLGAGLARILEGIERYGTLTRAVEELSMSYRYAWGKIRAAEKDLDLRLLHSRSGGTSGGHSSLTTEARRLLSLYRNLCEDVGAHADSRFSEFDLKNQES